MPEKEERTFFLYSDGYSPQELGLGHLVFGTFARPTKGRQCPMQPLSSADLELWANVQLRSDFCYSSESLRGLGTSVTALDLVKIGVSAGRDLQQAVAAKRCRRITLKKPQQFLSEKVLAVDSTKKTVQEWLSISTNEYALRKLTPLGWWPKIWMITGVYELEDCTSFSWRKSDVSAEADVAAEIMALLNIPFGGGGSIYNTHEFCVKQTFLGKSIWAAEYQLVGAEFMRVSSSERDQLPAPLQLPLSLKAVYSASDKYWRQQKGAQTERKARNNMAVLGLMDEVSSGQDDGSEWEGEFWEQYTKVEEDWQNGYDIDE